MSETQQPDGHEPNPMILGANTLTILGVEAYSSIQVVTPWYRGGAETYVSDFILTTEDKPPKHLIAKACIKMSPGLAMAEWFQRRERLIKNGVEFPALYAVDEKGATWVEEFIPYTFRDAFRIADEEQKATLKNDFIRTYLKMEGVGFAPQGLHDIRSRGTDVIVIDVGEDLGGWKENTYCDLGAHVRAEKFFRAESKH